MKGKKVLRLGERELELVFAFEERKQRLFTTKDAKDILGGSDASVKNVLKRLNAKHRVIRVERGKYLFAPMESGREGLWSEHSLAVVPALVGAADYYVGLLTALSYWGMTEQVPVVVHVVTRKKKRPLEAFGARYVFHDMEPGDREQIEVLGTRVNVSSREQTVLDCLAHPEHSLGVAGVAQGLGSARRELDWARLVELCLNEKAVVRRRLGYLLDLLGEGRRAKRLEERFTGFAWLDPSRRKARLGYSRKWGLVLNVPEDDLLEHQRIC